MPPIPTVRKPKKKILPIEGNGKRTKKKGRGLNLPIIYTNSKSFGILTRINAASEDTKAMIHVTVASAQTCTLILIAEEGLV